jgi:hypothetical protein
VLNGVSQPAGVYNNSTSPNSITGSGSLQVLAATPPEISASLSGATLTITWPASHIGWILQAQTNSLQVGLSTNWFDVAGSAAGTSSKITVNPAAPAVFYRLSQP